MAAVNHPTLASLARKLGLSVSSVSYALRNHPHTAAETKRRVMEAAREMNYCPNPAVALVMGQIRRGRRPDAGTAMAFVWVEATRKESRTDPFYRQVVAGAEERATSQGFRLEQHWLRDPGMNPKRLSQVLKARGIAGVVFSPCNHDTVVKLEWDWANYAMAVIGNAPWPVELHRAVHHHYAGMKTCIEKATEFGAKRCIAILDATVNFRAGRAWEAAFVTLSPPYETVRSRIWLGSADATAEARAFAQQHDADCIITSSPSFAPKNAAKRPDQKAPWWVVLNRALTTEDFPGIDSDLGKIAGNAVDLVIGQLNRNERGVPEDPKLMHFNGHWVAPFARGEKRRRTQSKK